MDLHSSFNLSILYQQQFKSGIETPDHKGQWHQHLQNLFASFYESNTKGTNVWITLYAVCLYNVHVLYCAAGSPNAYYMLLV